MIPSSLPGRALALAIAGGAVMTAVLAAGSIADARSEIVQAADRLARFRAAASRPEGPVPLVANADDELRVLVTTRLSSRPDLAVRLDGMTVEPDPRHAEARRIVVTLRGTADALRTLLSDQAAAVPPLLAQRVALAIVRPADADEERPTLIKAEATFPAFVAPAPETGRQASERRW